MMRFPDGALQSPVAHGRPGASLRNRQGGASDAWSIQDKKQPGAVVLHFKVPGKDDAQLHFVAFSLPAGATPKLLLGARLAVSKGRLKGFEVVTDKEHLVNGLAGHKVEFKHTKGEGKARRVTEVVWRTAAAGYLLTLDVEESAFDEVEKDFTAILDKFENLDVK